jgi:hypothetical protein
MDFTLDRYKQNLTCLIQAGYSFQTYQQFIENPLLKVVILRHDVDLRPINSLTMAQIENQLGICSSFYFRIVKKSNNPKIIKQIAELGHEIGYHYETMDTCKGNIDEAYMEFCRNLEIFRKIAPIKTVCMHGSPMSKFDNRDIWKKYDYTNIGITGEPYFDIDFSKVLYLTDTGRRWNGGKVSIRDKEQKSTTPILSDSYNFHSTFDIIRAINEKTLPDQVMINFHPQRWSNNLLLWTKELIAQNIKNQVKRIIIAVKQP